MTDHLFLPGPLHPERCMTCLGSRHGHLSGPPDLTPAEMYIAKKASAKLSAALKLLSDAKYAIEALPPELLDTLGAPNAVAFMQEVMNRVADARRLISPQPVPTAEPSRGRAAP